MKYKIKIMKDIVSMNLSIPIISKLSKYFIKSELSVGRPTCVNWFIKESLPKKIKNTLKITAPKKLVVNIFK